MINLISLIGLFVVIVCNIYIVAFVSFKKNQNMNKYKVSWYDDTENVWKFEIVEAKWYDDAFKIVKNMGYNGSICEPVY